MKCSSVKLVCKKVYCNMFLLAETCYGCAHETALYQVISPCKAEQALLYKKPFIVILARVHVNL